MDGAETRSSYEVNLSHLRTRTLERIIAVTALVGYAWLTLLVWPVTRGSATTMNWIAMATLVAASAIGYLLRHRLGIASMVVMVGTITTIAGAMLATGLPELAHLFVLPILFGSALLAQGASICVAVACLVATLLIGTIVLGLPPLSPSLTVPVFTLGLGAVAATETAHNLYTALEWVWTGFQQARRNERVARENQAELRRALKALDEATYRLERANQMLAAAREQAEEASRLKQQFAQTISHELRTPLNLIVGFTELMVGSPEYYDAILPPAYARDLTIVHRNARHLQSLVDDVLDLARIDAGQMRLSREECDPVALVREAVSMVQSLADSRHLALRSEVQPGLPLLWVDPVRVRQVLINLLNNAIRFTDQGSVQVRVWREADNVVFSVADTGSGIAPEDLRSIFEEFRQLDGSRRRRHEGAGLGLAICKRFVELHGGRIWAESHLGQGSVFCFTLPIRPCDPLSAQLHHQRSRGAQQAVEKSPTTHAGEPTLLVITGSPAAAAFVTRSLQGFHTVVSGDVEHARDTATQLLPQLVVIDTTDDPTNASTVEVLSQQWSLPDTLFIACPLPREETRLHNVDVDGYLVKPVTRKSLQSVLRGYGKTLDKVLVIDDDRDFVQFMERLLIDPVRRYEVCTAFSGREGLDMIRLEKPGLVLLDLALPDMHGFDVVKRVRSMEGSRHLPIVIVSAQDEINAATALRGIVLVSKPSGFLPGGLVELVRAAASSITRQVPSTHRSTPPR